MERLPYSIRVLLENAIRNSEAREAEEATERLARWPSTQGEEIPFMPYRVLLQDYTGVPLIVDLAAMRDAAKAAGLDPRAVDSQVPVDLVIDHSVQVDSWGSDLAFSANLEKEYERNSERYSVLKWAQSSFRGLRVFPPGKGICHQVNLEYISRVVATSEAAGRPRAFPDTLVGTDSHTTMVNGLGVLGWGVGGIEAEAVMLGEPYHMPIPKVLGVKFVGSLREGVTPTDLVLTVTEKLRERNVVGWFVEYFGDGYGRLSVPDRATLGNMSPEYGATVGFCPVDEATLAYLTGTGRDPSHVELVEKYARAAGFFAGGVEPRYSDVLTIDLDSVEASIAGPRNPEERRSLLAVPAFARTLLDRAGGADSLVPDNGSAGSSSGQVVMQQGRAAGDSGWNLIDGAVIIAAITSCTNTSNPTVMVGAGLLAKKAVELGLAAKPWVKTSMAPGSTVVTDYLQNSGLLQYLDRLGFNVVGYACTTCIAEGAPILMADGTTRPIESLPESGGASVFGPSPVGRLGFAKQSRLLDNGERDCVELILQDGRTLTCTPDHRVLCSDGRWVCAGELRIGVDRVVVGLEGPSSAPGDDESGFMLHAGEMTFGMEGDHERARTLAFARLLGHLLNDGSISTWGQARMNVGQAIDREAVLTDVELLTGARPAANRYDELKWSIALPKKLTKAIIALPGVQTGRRILQTPSLPEFVLRDDCPTSLVREFLGGLFGADGHSPILRKEGPDESDSILEPPALSQSTVAEHVEDLTRLFQEIIRLLARCGVKTAGARLYQYPTRRSKSSYEPALDGIPRFEVRLDLPDGLSFVEHLGFRYCVEKAMRASAAAVYWRLVDGINRQRLWMAAQMQDLHRELPALSFSQARHMAAVSLLGNEARASLPPVVSPHYALLEGADRFSGLPRAEGRRFYPLHRDSYDFPSPAGLLQELGARGWFAPPRQAESPTQPRRYCVEKEATTLPTFTLKVVGRKPAGRKRVYDLTVEGVHAFVAGTVAVHNCIGNSGPLAPEIERQVKERDLYAVAVLSGNRNFDGRIHPLAKGAFLMSPVLVVAYALAGRIDFDFYNTPLGVAKDGRLVYLKDIWPRLDEVQRTVQASLRPDLYKKRYGSALEGDERWRSLASYSDSVYHWEPTSTYIRLPPWFSPEQSRSSRRDVKGARVLAVLGDKVTTDHISPAGTIPVDSPAGKYLLDHGVDLAHFSSFGSRRGNHDVMHRGGFCNIRLKNSMAGGKEGGWTSHVPDGERMTIFDAAEKYAKEGTPLLIIAGKQYGAGSSRDWAAKAPKLLGVRAVIAEDFERIHRSNLIAMGVVPLQFKPGESAKTLGLDGTESYDVEGLAAMKGPREWLQVTARSSSGERKFSVQSRIDNSVEMKYFDFGGVLPYVFSKIAGSGMK